MARTGRFMSNEQKAAWAQYYDEQVAAGAKVRRGRGMQFVQDETGCWFQRNGDACPGKGWDAQARAGMEYDVLDPRHSSAKDPRYDQPPTFGGNKGKRTRTPWPWEKA